MTDDIRRLLGGYATGTLTAEERQELFAAALNDEALFAALADEEALKELLEDPAARAELLRATEARHFSVGSLVGEWFDRPKAKVLVGISAILLAAIVVRETIEWRDPTPRTQTVAELRVPGEPGVRPVHPRVPEKPQPKPKTGREMAKRKQSSDHGMAADQKQEAVGEVRLASPQQSAVSPAPAPADVSSPDAFTRVSTADGLELKYTVLLRKESGEYIAVPLEHRFAPGDHARIRVESNRPGMLSVRGAGDITAVTIRNVRAGSPVVLPADVTFDSARPSQTVRVSFLAEAAVTARALSGQRYSPPPALVERRADSLRSSESRAAGATKTSSGPGVLTLDITLGQNER